MDGGQASTGPCAVKSGDIAVADDRLPRAGDQIVLQRVHDFRRAIAAPDAEDRLDLWIIQSPS